MALDTTQIKSNIDSELPSSPPGAVRGLGASRLRTVLKYIIDWIAASLFNPKGAWAPGTAYAVNEIITRDGSTYRVVTPFTSGSSFSATNLELLAGQGWSPVFAAIISGSKVVRQLTGWIGGTGVAPGITSGGDALYESPTGLTTTIANATDFRGPQGYAGWSAVFAAIVSGDKVLHQLNDWVGGEGTKPAITTPEGQPYYQSSTGLTTTIANATDFRGAQGFQGWSPVHGSVPNGQNIVLQLLDWTGGAGTKPAITSGGNPLYVSSTGYTTNINAATNFNPVKKSVDAGSVSTAYTADMSQADDLVISMTITSNVTLTISNPTLGRTLTLYVTQGGAGNFSIIFPAAVKFPGGAAVDFNTGVGGLTVITMEANSTTSLVGYHAKH